MRNIIVRGCALLLGLAAVWWSVGLVGEPYRDAMAFRHAAACPAGSAGSAGSAPRDCIARETGRVLDTYRSDDDYRLTIRRASEKTEDHDASHALYEAAHEGDPADLEVWHDEVVAITVRGERHESGPSSGLQAVLALLPAWGGLGLLLWAAFGGGRLGALFGWAGMRAFTWMFLGVWTLVLLVGPLIVGASGWGLVVSLLAWLFGAGVCGVLLRHSDPDGTDGRRHWTLRLRVRPPW